MQGERLREIQRVLRGDGIDAWLFCDFRGSDPIGRQILGLGEGLATRRWFYCLPAESEPRGLASAVEPSALAALPGTVRVYRTWQELHAGLRALLDGCRRVAMQYSPNNDVPYVARVDAGTVELVRGTGVEVVSSAELIQAFEARWTPEALETHLEAGRHVDRIRAAAFDLIRERTRNKAPLQEIEVKQFVLDSFARAEMITDHGPIVGVNANASNPHYEPSAQTTSPIRSGDFVLLDMWAKLDRPSAVFYDITWTGFCGDTPTDEMRKVFAVVTGARDAAIQRVQTAIASGQLLHGYEVDDVARGFIDSRGFGSFFTHRTGHSIGQEVHGNGANMDNLETHDERRVSPWTCFSIEPGVYLPEFGIRSEVNMFIGDTDARVTGEIQRELLAL